MSVFLLFSNMLLQITFVNISLDSNFKSDYFCCRFCFVLGNIIASFCLTILTFLVFFSQEFRSLGELDFKMRSRICLIDLVQSFNLSFFLSFDGKTFVRNQNVLFRLSLNLHFTTFVFVFKKIVSSIKNPILVKINETRTF